MIKVTQQILDSMVDAIVKEIDPEMIFLFGSHASGATSADSDVDFLIVERGPFGPTRSRRKEIEKARGALSGFPVPKDILVYSVEEMDKWRDSVNHILSRIRREGKMLYERL